MSVSWISIIVLGLDSVTGDEKKDGGPLDGRLKRIRTTCRKSEPWEFRERRGSLFVCTCEPGPNAITSMSHVDRFPNCHRQLQRLYKHVDSSFAYYVMLSMISEACQRALHFNANGSPAEQCSNKNENLVSVGTGGSVIARNVNDNVEEQCNDETGSDHSVKFLSNSETHHLRERAGRRLVVVHNYHDHLNDPCLSHPQRESRQTRQLDSGSVPPLSPVAIGGTSYEHLIFPEKLHDMLYQLEKEGLQHIACWKPHGRCFIVGNRKEFVETVAPRYVQCEDSTLANA
jgi:HSF-type DNA-binding